MQGWWGVAMTMTYEALTEALDDLAAKSEPDDYIWAMIESLLSYCGDEATLSEVTQRFMVCATEVSEDLRVPDGATLQ